MLSGAIFGAVRQFAGGAPHTMTKEYQEASDEYLRVRTQKHPQTIHRILTIVTGAKGGAYHRYRCRGLQGIYDGPGQPQGHQGEGGLNETHIPVEFVKRRKAASGTPSRLGGHRRNPVQALEKSGHDTLGLMCRWTQSALYFCLYVQSSLNGKFQLLLTWHSGNPSRESAARQECGRLFLIMDMPRFAPALWYPYLESPVPGKSHANSSTVHVP